MAQILDFKTHKRIKYLEQDLQEKAEIAKIIKSTIKDLTTYEDYRTIKRVLVDLHVLYQDIKRERTKNLEHLERLKNEQEAMVED